MAARKPRKRVLTRHALDRYRQRIDRDATDDQVQAALDEAKIRVKKPGGITSMLTRADRWAVTGIAVFVMHRAESGSLVAVTCLKRRRTLLTKADIRALREEARDALGEAA